MPRPRKTAAVSHESLARRTDKALKTGFIVPMILIVLVVSSAVFADVTPGEISSSLKKNPEHPYLFFTESGKT